MSERPSPAPGLRLLPLGLLTILSVIWGLGPSIVKFVAQADVPPLGLVFWQTLVAGCLLLVVCLALRLPVGFDRRFIRYYLVMGVVGVALPNTNMVLVMRDLPVGLMGVIIITSPVITYLAALAIRLERFVAMRAGGVVLGFLGAAVLVLPEGSLPSPDLLPLALLAFLTPTLWALTNVFAEVARPKEGNIVSLAMGTMFAGAAGALVASLATDSFHPIWVDPGPEAAMIVAFGVLTMGAFTLYYTIVKMAGAVYLAQIGYLIPLWGVVWGAWFYDEVPSVWLWAAMALIFAGVGLVNFGGRRPAAKPAAAPAD